MLAKHIQDAYDAAQAHAQSERIARLEEALRELLQDTQHSEHHCGDEKNCPVLKARAALESK